MTYESMRSADVVIGRTPQGDRVRVQVTLTRDDRELTTIDHAIVQGGWRLSIVGEIIGYRCREPYACGQVQDDEALRLIPQTADVQALRQAWQSWHLNDMRAGCAHVPDPVMKREWYGDVPDLDATPACEETGYRYGHAWLYAPLPGDVQQWAERFIASHPA